MKNYLVLLLSALLTLPIVAVENFNLEQKAQQLMNSPEMHKSLTSGSKDKWIWYLEQFAAGNTDKLGAFVTSIMKGDENERLVFGAISTLISENMGYAFYKSLGLEAEWNDLISMKDRFEKQDPEVLQKGQQLQKLMLEKFSQLPELEANSVKEKAETDILAAVNLLITLLKQA